MASHRLNEVCAKIAEQCLAIRAGEAVLLLTDESTSPEVIAAMEHAVTERGASISVAKRRAPQRPHELPPGPVIWAIKGADVIIDLSKYDILHTLPIREALLECGARLLNMTGLSADDLTKPNIADVDYEAVHQQALRLVDVLEKGSTFRYTTPKGTCLTAEISNRQWYPLDGIARTPGSFAVFPIGEVLGSAVPGTPNGTVVLDFLALFGRLKTPMVMTVKNGWVTQIEGGEEAERLREMWSEVENANYVGELGGIGLNPLNTPADRLDAIEVMMKMGVAHIGFGDSLTYGHRVASKMHLNGSMLDVTIEVDGKPVVADNQILV